MSLNKLLNEWSQAKSAAEKIPTLERQIAAEFAKIDRDAEYTMPDGTEVRVRKATGKDYLTLSPVKDSTKKKVNAGDLLTADPVAAE